jgi:hypothetical protein
MNRPLIASLLGLSLSGCAASVQPLDKTTGTGSSASFDSYVEAVDLEAGISAVAVAKDAGKWSMGSWNGAQNEFDAITGAMGRCRSSAARDGVMAPCKIYSVNGVVVTP